MYLWLVVMELLGKKMAVVGCGGVDDPLLEVKVAAHGPAEVRGERAARLARGGAASLLLLELAQCNRGAVVKLCSQQKKQKNTLPNDSRGDF